GEVLVLLPDPRDLAWSVPEILEAPEYSCPMPTRRPFVSWPFPYSLTVIRSHRRLPHPQPRQIIHAIAFIRNSVSRFFLLIRRSAGSRFYGEGAFESSPAV